MKKTQHAGTSYFYPCGKFLYEFGSVWKKRQGLSKFLLQWLGWNRSFGGNRVDFGGEGMLVGRCPFTVQGVGACRRLWRKILPILLTGPKGYFTSFLPYFFPSDFLFFQLPKLGTSSIASGFILICISIRFALVLNMVDWECVALCICIQAIVQLEKILDKVFSFHPLQIKVFTTPAFVFMNLYYSR